MRRGFLLSDSDSKQRAGRSPRPPVTSVTSLPASAPSNLAAIAPASQTIVKIPSYKVVRADVPRFCESVRERHPLFKQYPDGGPDVPAHLITTALLYNGMEEEIRSTLSVDRFPMPFSPPSPPVYKIVQVDGFGLSMVATTNIARGQTIVVERPLLVHPQVVAGPLDDALELYEQLVDRMRPENRDAVYALMNAKGPECPSHLMGIQSTNSLAIGKLPGYPAMYGALARDISRVNHSCSPNARSSFDLATLTVVLRALTPIRAGEQITISYIGLETSRTERREELSRGYKFHCMCKVCNRPERDVYASDINRLVFRRRAMDSEAASDEEAFEKWLADGAPLQTDYISMFPRTTAELWQAFERQNGFMRATCMHDIMEKENIFPPELWEPVLARLVIGHSVLENEGEVRRHALLAALLKTAETGSDGGWAAVVRNPRGTNWWGKRV